MIKSELREKYKKIRYGITEKDVKSTAACKMLSGTDMFKCAQNIALYTPIDTELDTNYLIKECLKKGKRVFLPVTHIDFKRLEFYEYKSGDNLKPGAFGILEPIVRGREPYSAEKFDLIVIPGLCFDTMCGRLGYGGGYYDRFLQNVKCIKIGICYEEQILQRGRLPADSFDVTMDFIVTDKEIYS